MLVDTHCHLADPAFDGDRDAVLRRAAERGVRHVVAVGESPERTDAAIALAAAVPWVSATAGVHPHEAARWSPDLATWLTERLAEPTVVAAGEMGLDYHYDHAPRPQQRAAFDAQLGLAAAAGKPAVIHAREADDDIAAVLAGHPRTVAILHSFSSGPRLLDTALAMGHYVSFSGMVTFRSWTLDDAIRSVPAERLLLETDAPYLAPAPHRGHRNEPAHVQLVAERVAAVRGLPVAALVALTGRNARAVFGTRLDHFSQESA